MNFKKTAAALAAIMLLSSTAASARTLEFTIGSPDMYISDASIEKKVLDCKPYTSNDRTLVPVRVISENFGAKVNWDDATQRVDITADDTQITLHIGSNTAEVNGEEITLDVSPELTDSRTMVPLRFISEALGKRVEYVEPSEQVLISDDGYAISVDDFDISIDDIRFYAATKGLLTDKEQLSKELPELLSEITGNAALSSEAKKAGITQSEDDTDIFTDYLLAYKDNLYGIGSLLAPGIKMYTNESHGSVYLGTVNITPDNEELLNLYNREYIRVKHILIKSFDSNTAEYYDDVKKAEMKKKAEDILFNLKKGEDFDSLHKEYNEDDESFFYPDGMTIKKDEIIESFAEAAFALKENEISEIVESQYGYHIIKRLPLSELDEKIFEEIESSIVPYLYKINAVKNANIVYHMTNEEIVDKLIK